MRNLLLVAVALLPVSQAFAQGNACDRACLESTVDQFVDAFVRHDPKLAPLTRTVKFTENGQTLPVGDGSWRTDGREGNVPSVCQRSESRAGGVHRHAARRKPAERGRRGGADRAAVENRAASDFGNRALR